MIRSHWTRRGLAVLILGVAVGSVSAQPHEGFKNLKVLPETIKPEELRAVMGGFTRALGVRCLYCHVGEEGKSMQPALDDKPTKRKARDMMRMVNAINGTYLAGLESRSDPPVRVQCVTCHRGASTPRMLEDVLTATYEKGGMDSTLARYQALHDRYYGRFTYDFGEVPLVQAAHQIEGQHPDDALRLLAFNVQQNPNSAFAKREHATAAIVRAFREDGTDAGTAEVRKLKTDYSDAVVNENLMNDVGYELMDDHIDQAIAVFRMNVADHPSSANAFDSMGEAYMRHQDWKLATQAYTQSLTIDPNNENAKHMLQEIKTQSKGSKKKKSKS
jgi:tetratricopeptide (TPR) repeat protein